MMPTPDSRNAHSLFAKDAYLPEGWGRNVLLQWNDDGVLTAVTPNAAAPCD
ncbi:MAG: formimidoylglutamate deiminase, partial [Paraburkholderia sp.]|nr:formimidoylglutamate deiminase [Paraburkholderia sp.]